MKSESPQLCSGYEPQTPSEKWLEVKRGRSLSLGTARSLSLPGGKTHLTERLRPNWTKRESPSPLCAPYSVLAPHLLSCSTQTPPAFSHSALFFASFSPAKAAAVRAVAAAKLMNAKRSVFMVILPL
jgi:hypothetical protein